METVEASIVLSGMEVRVMEVLNDRIVDIQRDTEIAVTKAIEAYDFDEKIGEIITEWLDEKIRDMSIILNNSKLLAIETEMARMVTSAMKSAIVRVAENKCSED